MSNVFNKQLKLNKAILKFGYVCAEHGVLSEEAVLEYHKLHEVISAIKEKQ